MAIILCIAHATFREAIRSKVLYVIFFFLVVLLSLSSFFGSVTIGESAKVIKDFAFLSISLFGAIYCSIVGSSLLAKELTRKTIQNILSKAVSRDQFIAGKCLGLSAVTLSLVAGMGLLAWVFICVSAGDCDPVFWQGILPIAGEALVVSAASIFFSTLVVTPVLGGLFTAAFFLAARSSTQILALATLLGEDSLAAKLLRIVYSGLPHLDQLSVSDRVVYGDSIAWMDLFSGLVYAAGYALVLLGFSIFLFRRRQFP